MKDRFLIAFGALLFVGLAVVLAAAEMAIWGNGYEFPGRVAAQGLLVMAIAVIGAAVTINYDDEGL